MFAILLHESMDPFYQNISSFPTVVFTFVLAICLFFWMVAVLGMVDIDSLDFDIPGADALGHHGIGHDISGIGHDIGHHDFGDIGPDVTNANALAGLMLRFGLHGVPVTIIISLMALFGWLISYYAVHYLFFLVPGDILRYVVGLGVLIGATYIAAIITGLLIKPLRPLFKKAQTQSVKHILGQTAVVRTSRVDTAFGEATLADGAAGLILKVRATGETTFKKGDRVVLFEHLTEQNVYRVVSEEEFSG